MIDSNMKETNTPRISVIIPVYKTEKYLAKCLESVVKQTLKEIEIIVLNDGSPDNSEEIIKEYTDLDDRIIYYKHDNMGLGLTRNMGIKAASGEYLAFVDSDDYIDSDMYESMYAKAKEENLDIVTCETMIEEEAGGRIDKTIAGTENFSFFDSSWKDFADNIFYKGKYRGWAWNKLYRRRFIIENQIAFGDNKLVFSEDLYFQFHALICSPTIGFTGRPFYHYVQRPESITNSAIPNYFKKHLWLVNHFFEINCEDKEYEAVVSSILLRGIIDEAGHVIKYGQGFREFRKSIEIMYEHEAYAKFSRVNRRSKGREIVPFRRRRILSTGFCFFQRMNMRFMAELYIFSIRRIKV